ncbi:MAG: hypothetical protein QXI58_00395 [Candidatus Micrarchaeia archaeon]|jgi:hypothetical protein
MKSSQMVKTIRNVVKKTSKMPTLCVKLIKVILGYKVEFTDIELDFVKVNLSDNFEIINNQLIPKLPPKRNKRKIYQEVINIKNIFVSIYKNNFGIEPYVSISDLVNLQINLLHNKINLKKAEQQASKVVEYFLNTYKNKDFNNFAKHFVYIFQKVKEEGEEPW